METPADEMQGDQPLRKDEGGGNADGEYDDRDDEETGTTVRENIKEPVVHDNGGVLEESRATAASNTPLTKLGRGHDEELGVSLKHKRNSVHR